MEYIQVITTTEKMEDAERIARALLEKRLVACVQIIGPMVSTYWWNGRIETAGEYLCLMKTREDLYAEVEKTIKGLHPYEVPEIVALDIVKGQEDYLEWLRNELSRA